VFCIPNGTATTLLVQGPMLPIGHSRDCSDADDGTGFHSRACRLFGVLRESAHGPQEKNPIRRHNVGLLRYTGRGFSGRSNAGQRRK